LHFPEKGRDQLISLSTLDMCEMFIAEMAKEEEEQNKMEKGKPTADSSNLQLQVGNLFLEYFK
jgi:hypothetical protein